VRDFGTQKGKEVIMSMKKLISLALCLVIALAFAAGCKKKEEAMAPAETAAPAPEAAMAPMSSATTPVEAPVEAPAAK
jgi:preprotein translocase subunit SecY